MLFGYSQVAEKKEAVDKYEWDYIKPEVSLLRDIKRRGEIYPKDCKENKGNDCVGD